MNYHKILSYRKLTNNTYILRFERKDVVFTPGQYFCVGLPDDEDRPYSIYSGEKDDYLEILIKEVKEEGNVSKKLNQLETGALVSVKKPHGFFCIQNKIQPDQKFVFIATGTGIAPFHSFIRSYPDLSYTIIHGIKTVDQSYESDAYASNRYISCTSKDSLGKFPGRITEYLKAKELDPEAYYYLCGNSEMIDEVYDILELKKISRDQIRTEMYY